MCPGFPNCSSTTLALRTASTTPSSRSSTATAASTRPSSGTNAGLTSNRVLGFHHVTRRSCPRAYYLGEQIDRMVVLGEGFQSDDFCVETPCSCWIGSMGFLHRSDFGRMRPRSCF
ncbi:hypothetical protein C1H46_023036 [Malus baccata]|uniref:Uncharacterized protein n=1 Tax=Malus baccata TaxID=106549 RepID=A0A540LXY4_MALBA|nr:hypothetical protein C1H46_023036 [Malus baccata]